MSSSTFPARARQVHLDFHTSPFIPAVGADFDPEEFGRVIEDARVDSMTLFAKCHHGHLYYDTEHPARHPGMGEALLEKQVEALRGRNIKCPIYLSVQCDEYAANTHPEWRAVNPDGSFVGQKPLGNDAFTWRILDMSSPYLEYLEEQTAEVMRKFAPVDGLFFDMCWDQVSVSKWAIAGMQRENLDPANPADRALYANRVTHRYMERLTAVAAKYQKDVPIWFNSRPIADASKERRFLRHIEIEALPSGQWGYSYFPVWVRYAKTLGLPMIGMTGRFHKSWADFGGLRTPASLLYDCAQALAHGGGCSVGDQLHPSGVIDRGVYDVIGQVYRHVEKCEPWCRDVVATNEIAVLLSTPASERHGDQCFDGITKALSQLRYQFAFIDPDADWSPYAVVIVPESLVVTPELEQRLTAYKAAGGKVLRDHAPGEESPFSAVYLRFDAGQRGTLADTVHVFYERGNRLVPEVGDDVLARIVEPYFERGWEKFSSHAQTPNVPETSPYAAAVVRGNEAIFALPVFRAYSLHGNLPCRQLVAAALERLLPAPIVRVKGPSYVEVTAGTRGGETILHFLSYIPQKRAATQEMVEDAAAARNVGVDVKVEGLVASVKRVIDGGEIPFQQEGGRMKFSLDWLEGHEMVVISRR